MRSVRHPAIKENHWLGINTHTQGYKPTSSWPKVITSWQPMPFTRTLPAPASINIFPCYSLTLPLNALNQVLKGWTTARRHFIHCRDGRFKYKWMHSLSKPQQTPNTLLWWVLEKNALWTATFTYSVEAVTLLEKWHCNSMIPHKSLNHLALSHTRTQSHFCLCLFSLQAHMKCWQGRSACTPFVLQTVSRPRRFTSGPPIRCG